MTLLLTRLGSLKNGAKCMCAGICSMPRDNQEGMGLQQDNAELGGGKGVTRGKIRPLM